MAALRARKRSQGSSQKANAGIKGCAALFQAKTNLVELFGKVHIFNTHLQRLWCASRKMTSVIPMEREHHYSPQESQNYL